jgi:hypothetical protein
LDRLQSTNDVQAGIPPLLAVRLCDFLYRFGHGQGSIALSLLYKDGVLAAESDAANPLAAKQPHFPANAKSCIFSTTCTPRSYT